MIVLNVALITKLIIKPTERRQLMPVWSLCHIQTYSDNIQHVDFTVLLLTFNMHFADIKSFMTKVSIV